MAETEKNTVQRVQLLLGPLVGVIVMLFSLTDLYDSAELITYDWRFKSRNTVFGLPEMDSNLSIIAMDNKSLEVEGRYQDWTRDKYTDVVRFLSESGAQMVGFDVFFTEPSLRAVTEEAINGLKVVNQESINALLFEANHDERFQRTIKEAGNVYLGQIFEVPPPDEEMDLEKLEKMIIERTADKEDAFEALRQWSPKLMVDQDEISIWRGFDFTPPTKLLRDAAKGFAFAQTVADPDGARRRYPLVYQYEDIVLPSLALLMVCDRLDVPIKTVEVHPDKHIKLPKARLNAETVKDILIPIDLRGNMNVNWAGEWDQTFERLPHINLRWAGQILNRQKRLDAVKQLAATNPDLQKNPRQIPAALEESGFVGKRPNREAVALWKKASDIEAIIRKTPDMDLKAYLEQQGIENPNKIEVEMFNQIRLNNRMAEILLDNPEMPLLQLFEAFKELPPLQVEESAIFVRGLIQNAQLIPTARPLYHFAYTTHEGRLIYPEDMRDKILFYGLTADGTSDLSIIPFQGDYPMVGIYPNVFNTILTENFIRRMPSWLNALLIVSIGLLIAQTVPRFKVLQGALLVVVILIVYCAVTFIAFTHAGYWVEVAGPMMTLIVGYLVLTIYGYLIKEQEKDFVQGAFGHFLSPVVVDQIMQNPDMLGQLGGEERVMTAFFSDVASFSTISECLTPIELVTFINEYLSEMCDVIEYYGGTIDKFEGDAIVGFFGAPIFYEDHGMRAVMACIDQQKKLVELRQLWNQEGKLPLPLRQLRQRWEKQHRTFAQVRMGVTSGPMVVGNMGSRTRTDYTMMGDTVNLAARFESGQKIYGTNIMINDLIYEQVKDVVEARKLDLLQVVGKEEPVIAYEVLSRKGELDDKKSEVLGLFAQGIAAYEAYEFVAAQKHFEKALAIDPFDGPSALYVDRCEDHAANPPTDLIFRATDK
jgi:class 3 adenylate cyclase/CHASE2 domain-containing sensor protein